MWTATIKNKEFINGALKITVDYSDGITNVTETCIPQDEDGFKFWVKSRLATFNGGQVIDNQYATNSIVDVNEPVVVPPVLTQAEIDANNWLDDYRRWVKIKTTLIDTGIITGNETQIATFKAKVQSTFKPTYINLI